MNQAEIELLVTPTCPHCAGMKQLLKQLKEQGKIGHFEIVDISQRPEKADQFGAREVPFLRLGEFEFSGSHTAGELEPWLPGKETARMPAYFASQLEAGNLARVIDRVKREPGLLPDIIALITEPEASIAVQLGVAAVMESLEGSEVLANHWELLGRLSKNSDPRTRADACHYLGLTGKKEALPLLISCLDDENGDVREIASESIEAINNG